MFAFRHSGERRKPVESRDWTPVYLPFVILDRMKFPMLSQDMFLRHRRQGDFEAAAFAGLAAYR